MIRRHFNKRLCRFGVSFFRTNSDQEKKRKKIFFSFCLSDVARDEHRLGLKDWKELGSEALALFNYLDANLYPTTDLLLGSQTFPEYWQVVGQNNAASSREPQRDQLLCRGWDHGAAFAPLTRAVGGLSEVPHRVRQRASSQAASSVCISGFSRDGSTGNRNLNSPTFDFQ